MLHMEALSDALTQRMKQENGQCCSFAVSDEQVIRRKPVASDRASIWRPAFVHDIDKILHCPYYNRYADKTQVFSLIKNDDITRRSLHVQLVSRIARTIGRALHLNEDLIEAISLGHDIGHPPFAHMGEKFLSEITRKYSGRCFSHNIHSVRVLDGIFPLNVSLQTLDGIATHNGEVELQEYRPEPLTDFKAFDERIRRCCQEPGYANRILPSTLEAAVVRVSDIIAYLGKDRQDAARVNVVEETAFNSGRIGSINAEIINNLVVNILENSYGKPYIAMDDAHYQALTQAKKDNYRKIYGSASAQCRLDTTVRPMMWDLYGQLLEDLKNNKRSSPVFTHHIDYVNLTHYHRDSPYEKDDPNQIVTDYIASMTDNYFVDVHHYMFPDSPYRVHYRGYFGEDSTEST